MPSSNLIRTTLIVTSISLALTACGGGGSDSSNSQNPSPTPTPTNTAPTVSAGEDQTFRVNTRAVVSAQASDSDGTIQSYKWEKTSIVAGEEYIELIDTDKATAYFDTNFTITEAQEYTLTVTVTDDDGATSSDSVVVKILPVEHVDIQLPDNINQARLTKINDNTVLVTGGCKSIIRVGGETRDCVEPSLRSFLLDIDTEILTEIENINFPKPYSMTAQSSVLLSDGTVMLNSQDIWDPEVKPHSAEIYDPQTQQFTPAATMNHFRAYPMPAALEDGSVIVFSDYGVDSIEVYSPITDSWTITDATFNTAASITATLPNNRVLLVGGDTPNGITYDSFIYDHNDQSFTEIAPLITPNFHNGKASGVFNNGGGDYRRVDLNDNSFCLLSHSTIPFGGADKDPIRFDLSTNAFIEDVGPCEAFWHLGGYSVDGDTFTNGHAMPGAAHIELKSDRVWISQQINDVEMLYNENCDCYDYKEPMTIRIIKH